MVIGIIQIPFAFDIVQIVQFFYGKPPEPTWKCHTSYILKGHIRKLVEWSFSNPVKTLGTYVSHWRDILKIFFLFMMFCINAVVAYHFKMFFGYMNNKSFNKIKGRYCLCYKNFIFMSIIVKSNI